MSIIATETNASARRTGSVSPRAMKSWSRNAAKARAAKAVNDNGFQASIETAAIERYRSGMGALKVAKSMNEAGYRTRRGCQFTAIGVWRILNRSGVLRRTETEEL
ncbi:hypothetical protein TA3x_000202 [Tundrisphaera sp. TA3]|uniref:hypothetical protein n=1 Tax=Tundrisphaera sp. TA3 TaxID=3435775 RepID=UPI003EBFE604